MKQNSIKSAEEYKQLEKEYNQNLLLLCNCNEFVVHCGKMLDSHLDEILTRRAITSIWLTKLGIPNKDEVANLVKDFVDIEARVDSLEELAHVMGRNSKSFSGVMNVLYHSILELSKVLENDFEEWKPKTELELLREELKDLLGTSKAFY